MENQLTYRSDQINELARALANAQKVISNPPKDAKNPYFKSSYSDLPTVLNVVRDVLPNHQLSFVQPLELVGDKIYLTTILMHSSGQWIKSYAPILCKDPTDPQKFGSGISYMRRYALQALIGIVGDDDEDDGNKANTPGKFDIKKWVIDNKMNADYDTNELEKYVTKRAQQLKMQPEKLANAALKNKEGFFKDLEKWKEIKT